MRTYERVGTILGTLVVGGLLILAIGLWQNWFSVSMEKNASGQSDLTFSVHPTAIQHDARAMGQQVVQAEQHLESLSQVKSVEGVVTALAPASQSLEIRTAAETTQRFELGQVARYRVKNHLGTLGDLRIGDRVTIVYCIRENLNVAEKVTVL